MAILSFDLDKLFEGSMIDKGLVDLFFYDNRDYYHKLTDFLVNNHNYSLSHYTPAFVMHSPEDKTLFLKECYQVRASLMQMGLLMAMDELDVMEEAVHHNDVKAFADGQIKYVATIRIYLDMIRGAKD